MEQIDSFDGIGIALAGGIAAIDIDHCIKDGKVSEMAEHVITLIDSYTYHVGIQLCKTGKFQRGLCAGSD